MACLPHIRENKKRFRIFLYLPICNWEHYTNTIPYSVAILSL